MKKKKAVKRPKRAKQLTPAGSYTITTSSLGAVVSPPVDATTTSGNNYTVIYPSRPSFLSRLKAWIGFKS